MSSCIRCTDKGCPPIAVVIADILAFHLLHTILLEDLTQNLRLSRPDHKFSGIVAYALCMSTYDDNITQLAKSSGQGDRPHCQSSSPPQSAMRGGWSASLTGSASVDDLPQETFLRAIRFLLLLRRSIDGSDVAVVRSLAAYSSDQIRHNASQVTNRARGQFRRRA